MHEGRVAKSRDPAILDRRPKKKKLKKMFILFYLFFFFLKILVRILFLTGGHFFECPQRLILASFINIVLEFLAFGGQFMA